MRFARVFNGAVVLRNISYIYITMDGRGNLKRIKIKWPKFVANNKVVGNFRRDNDALKELEDYCKSGKHLSAWKIDMPQECKTQVNGAALGWLPLKGDDGKIRITPAYSFTTSTSNENNQEFNRFIDIPINQNYRIDDKCFFNVTTMESSDNSSSTIAPVLRSKRE